MNKYSEKRAFFGSKCQCVSVLTTWYFMKLELPTYLSLFSFIEILAIFLRKLYLRQCKKAHSYSFWSSRSHFKYCYFVSAFFISRKSEKCKKGQNSWIPLWQQILSHFNSSRDMAWSHNNKSYSISFWSRNID